MAQAKAKKNSNRYVNISIDEMEAFMKSNFFVVSPRDKTQDQRELVYQFEWNDGHYMCKVYSSVTPLRGKARPVGGDAIRAVMFVLAEGRFVPMWKSPRVYRTKNWRVNLQRRIDECLVRGREGMDYECPMCDHPLVLRDGKNGKFWACSSWSRTKCSYTLDYKEQ